MTAKTLLKCILPAVCTPLSLLSQQTGDLPVFDMDAVEVIHSETRFAPAFTAEVPAFSYYEVPDLPRGELILALEFMDRYRDAAVPGQAKWAGLLHFPVVDGRDIGHLKWICLYFYDDRMFGYDPGAVAESDRRFAVPIQYADRRNAEVLFRFAESYVESVYPGGIEEVYLQEPVGTDEEDMTYAETIDYVDVPPGRIAPVLSSERHLSPQQLVRLAYQFTEEPNLRPDTPAVMGRPEGLGRTDAYTWSSFWDEFKGPGDPLTVALGLVAPRWGRVVVFHYPQEVLLLWKVQARQRVLLFNIGTRVYAYDPRFGVWRTRATLADLDDADALPAKLSYPGVDRIERVELLEGSSGKGD